MCEGEAIMLCMQYVKETTCKHSGLPIASAASQPGSGDVGGCRARMRMHCACLDTHAAQTSRPLTHTPVSVLGLFVPARPLSPHPITT